jgi:ethanolaminephosphotransferase
MKRIFLLSCLGFEIFFILFFFSFFPLKSYKTNDNIVSNKIPAQFDRVVLMLVDAFRYDFFFNDTQTMPFTQNLYKEGKTHSFIAMASPPTVTMPRIKALTTGNNPNYLDIILNLLSFKEEKSDSFSKLKDSWLLQFKKYRNWNISFYGDDTWLRLFPGLFSRYEGTTSFYVQDTVEVDLNVTRHIPVELERTDWDCLILHYLGLDHIGHLHGPYSPKIREKLIEMDRVVEKIYTEIISQDIKDQGSRKPTLFILLGDHGMNDLGNHGGSSFLEEASIFVFMSNQFHSLNVEEMPQIVDQIDLASTLSLLTGVPIPKNK